MKRGMLSHIEIYVSDLEKSTDFWGWFLTKLGYEPYQSWQEGRSWKLDHTYFVIVQVEKDFKNTPYHRKNIGLNHLAFHAETRADVDNMILALKERGITLLYQDKHPHKNHEGSYAVYFEDPDRIKVEFVST